MAQTKTSFDKEKQPKNRKPRGLGWRSQLFKVMRQESILEVGSNAKDEMVERAIIKNIAVEAFAGGPDAVPFMRVVLDKTFPNYKATHEPVNFELDTDGTPAEMVYQILDATAKGEIAPDMAAIFVGVVKDTVTIEESTDLKARIEALEELSK